MRLFAAAILALPVLASAADLTLPVLADTSISAFPSERGLNAGSSARLKLKGIENIILLLPDTGPLAGQVVDHAELRMKGCDERLMIHRIGISTVATAWGEGAGNYAAAGAGEASFYSAAQGQRAWAGQSSVLLDAVFARGGTMWNQAEALRSDDGWYRIAIDGRMLEACAAGLAHGLALSDDSGQTMNLSAEAVPQTNHGNNYLFAHEQGNARPQITVSVHPVARGAVAALAVTARAWPGGAGLDSGALELRWPGPPDAAARAAIIGYRVRLGHGGAPTELPRWQHPSVPPPGQPARMLLRELPAGAAYAAEIAVIGRGGVVMASGRASGHASAALSTPAALDFPVVPAQAPGAPPATAAGTVWAVPDLVQVDPLSGAVDADPGVGAAAAATTAGTWSQGNPAWSGSARTVHVAVPRGAWAAFQLVCAGRQPTTTWTITPGDLDGPGGARIPASTIHLARLWYQQVGGKWRPDPLVPLAAGATFQIPDARNGVPGQANQTVYVEWFVPAETSPGVYHGSFSIANDAGALPLAVELSVAPAVIPSAAAFTWSMNAYSSPGTDFGAPGSAEFLAAERAFYRLAHEHRTTLAILGYSHAADFQPDVAPPLTGSGTAMRVADWSAWDRRYGPLLDGSAFAGTARAAVPLDHFYLPFMESWPTPMAAGYRWNALTWEDHWRLAGPVAEGFSPEYRAQWIAVMRDFIAHIRAKGWRTSFQVYLNDKYYYKQFDARRKAAGHGTSFWLLDEPQHIDDFLALEFFGGLTRAAQAGDRTTIVQRVDLSRPEWGRDTLDQVIDLDVSGGFNGSRPLLEDWRARHDQHVWTYGSAPSSAEGALGIAAQALDLYSRGVDGFVPWMTLGSVKNWTEFEETCVIYCGKPVGVAGPCASLRLKAYRRGEEDAALLKAVATREGLLTDDPDRRRIGALIAPALGGGRALGSLDGQGAVTERLTGLTVERLDALRRALCARAAP